MASNPNGSVSTAITQPERDEFLAAWNQFGAACNNTVAPEATYQAWFAHLLIEQFGLLHVVREVDFGAKHLDEDDRALFSGSSLKVDVSVLRGPEVFLPHRALLGDKHTPEGQAARSGFGRLPDLLIATELKIGSTQMRGLD